MKIKEVIKRRGMAVKDVANIMGISAVGLSQHINGNPSVEVLERIANVIGCKVGDFFDTTNDSSIICPKCGTELDLTVEIKNIS